MRAQAEVLGFVFVFTIILLSVGAVTAFGIPGLQSLQEEEETTNMVRAFDILGDDLGDIYRGGAPRRATGMRIEGGSLSFGNETRLRVTAAAGGDTATFTSDTKPVVYDDGEGTELVYEAGAVVRSDRGASVLLGEPGWVVNESRVVIPLVTVENESEGALAGGDAVLRSSRAGTNTANAFEADGTVTLTVRVETPRTAAWESYLDEQGFTPTADNDPDNDVVEYSRSTARVYAPETTIDVELTR